MDAKLSDLKWRRLEVTLRNVRNKFARQHPLFVFKAILKHAARNANCPDTVLFHPRHSGIGERIRKGQCYELSFVFPRQTAAQVAAFENALAAQIARENSNFELLDSEVFAGSVESLMSATSKLDLSSEELCLDFLTPCRFEAEDRGRRWWLHVDQLIELVRRRVKTLFDLELPEVAADQLWTLPYFWDEVQYRQPEDKKTGAPKHLNGLLGPLYLRGQWQQLLPWLVLASEFHIGRSSAWGMGRFALRTGKPFFDVWIRNAKNLAARMSEQLEEQDGQTESELMLAEPKRAAAELSEEVAAGNYAPRAASAFNLTKEDGGTRALATLHPRDALLQRVVHRQLRDVLDRALQDGAVGFRPNRSVKTAKKLITRAFQEGYTHFIQTDIEEFFDHIDWDMMDRTLTMLLPQGDRLTCRLLEQFVRQPVEEHGKMQRRTRGIVQGSPLSPLLANLYLDGFDEAVADMGHRMIRYGDDILVLTKGAAAAEDALGAMSAFLESIGLRLNSSKTALAPVDLGFSFLGQDFAPDIDVEEIEKTTLRKPLYVCNWHSFVGIEDESVVVRRQGQTISRRPLRRVSEIIIMGTHSVSTALVRRCRELRIAISYCSLSGYHINTLTPPSRRFYEVGTLHTKQFEALCSHPFESARMRTAQELVAAKIHNYQRWLADLGKQGLRPGLEELDRLVKRLPGTRTMDSLRGLEGNAARITFSLVRQLVRREGFGCTGREPHRGGDPYNSLLDFAYYLLFTRLNALVRARGLNPYLGFLHSEKNDYESLVSDLQEPFRARMDRLVVKCINLRIIQAEHFEKRDDGKLRLGNQQIGRFIEAFERDLDTRLSGAPGSLRDLLQAQVSNIASWATRNVPLRFYRRPA